MMEIIQKSMHPRNQVKIAIQRNRVSSLSNDTDSSNKIRDENCPLDL